MPLGVVDGAPFEETVVLLEPGSSLVLYTDGLVQDRTTSVDEGMERLRRAPSACTDDPNEMCSGVLGHRDGALANDDDTAVLFVRRERSSTPPGAPPRRRSGPICPRT